MKVICFRAQWKLVSEKCRGLTQQLEVKDRLLLEERKTSQQKDNRMKELQYVMMTPYTYVLCVHVCMCVTYWQHIPTVCVGHR